MQKFTFQEVDQKAKDTTPINDWETWYDNLPRVQNTVSYIEIQEDKEIRLSFTKKPNEETRDIIKRMKFKWDACGMYWTRKLDKNGQKAFQKFVNEIHAHAI